MGDTENWSLEDLAAALRVAVDDFETFELAGADLLWGGSRDEWFRVTGVRAGSRVRLARPAG
jgi:hypothetical protein